MSHEFQASQADPPVQNLRGSRDQFIGSRGTTAAASESIPVWYGSLLVVVFWLMARPYGGVRHDGVLYMGQALMHVHPIAMSKDLFFVFGSQDSFSAFSRILALMYDTWGIAATQMLVLAVAHLTFMAAMAMILATSVSDRHRWLGLVCVAVLSHIYGGFGIFGFAETFVTARTVSEPLALLAIALLIRRQVGVAFAAWLIAALLHPLIALPVLVVAWLVLCDKDRRWLWALLLCAVPGALALLSIPPFTGLLQQFDAEWWSIVADTNRQVLVTRWSLVDWQVLAFDIAVLAAATRVLAEPLSRLCRAVIVATLSLILLSALTVDLLHNVLLTGLQLWRVQWLSHLLALGCLPAVFLSIWARGAVGRLPALALACATIAINASWETGWVFLVWAGIAAWLVQRPGISSGSMRLAQGATVAAALCLSVATGLRTMGVLLPEGQPIDPRTLLLVASTLPIISLPTAGWLLEARVRARIPGWILGGLLATALLVTAYLWDRRLPWVRHVESGLSHEHPFERVIPADAQVYWHRELPATWALLHRASYFSAQQGAGLLFNRQTAMEHDRRAKAFAGLQLQEQICTMLSSLNEKSDPQADCTPTQEVVEAICRFPQGPDFLIFKLALPIGVVAQWSFAGSGDEQSTNHYLYDCTKFH